MDIIDSVLFAATKLDGSQDYTAIQKFADGGIQIEDFVIKLDTDDLTITHLGTVIFRLSSAGVLTVKDLISDPALS